MPDKPDHNDKSKNSENDNAKPKPSKPHHSAFWADYIEKQKQKGKEPTGAPKNIGPEKDKPSKLKAFEQMIKPTPKQPKKELSAREKKEKAAQEKLTSTGNLLLQLLKADQRIRGRENFTGVFSFKAKDESGEDVKKQYVLCILYAQCFVGAIGGILVGYQTKFLSPYRLPMPNTPFPTTWNLPLARSATEAYVALGSIAWRALKRGVVAGLLFDYTDRQIEEYRNRRDWKNTAMAGGICGSLFGLRGGFHGPLQGAASFAVIGALGGYLFINRPSDKNTGAYDYNISKLKIKRSLD